MCNVCNKYPIKCGIFGFSFKHKINIYIKIHSLMTKIEFCQTIFLISFSYFWVNLDFFHIIFFFFYKKDNFSTVPFNNLLYLKISFKVKAELV